MKTENIKNRLLRPIFVVALPRRKRPIFDLLPLCLPIAAAGFLCTANVTAQTPSPAQTPPPAPCPNSADCRQFDFWLGDWDVTTPDGKKVATSRIQSVIGQCVILENYTESPSYEGMSMSFFDPVLGKWRQTWADTAGGVSEFTGKFIDGAMRFEGVTHVANGKTIQRRMTLSKLDNDRVRQSSEKSTDGGKTWTPAYDFTYIRRPASSKK
jgi:hypothetical protein